MTAEFGAPKPAAAGGGPVATTIDPRLQRAADAAVAEHAKGRLVGLVALSIDKGEVRALANAPTTGMNRACPTGNLKRRPDRNPARPATSNAGRAKIQPGRRLRPSSPSGA
ncbi:hypothetical protein [Embleya scabrispora]|uniref:hypothetical protein n=1 Tax=Embleya scabrispora TaxID=159449 RepID=UPI000372B9D7|nr:hypothetical protein [Embleya scabrispora]MYS80199.1 hypothetical protein [Streptomyces sp. SID5474]